jgi:hypothetical protein
MRNVNAPSPLSALPRLLLSTAVLALVATTGPAREIGMKPRTALVYDDIFLEHDTGPGFPESAERLRMMTKHLKEHPVSGRLLWVEPGKAIDPMPWILEMHDASSSRRGGRSLKTSARLSRRPSCSEMAMCFACSRSRASGVSSRR